MIASMSTRPASAAQADEEIMALAAREERILISADTDFGELLANSPVLAPSVILLRRTDKRPESLASVKSVVWACG
jgi:predicted nuclease of predicted toxin-antitoxin system